MYIIFVDSNDTVKYFNKAGKQIFVRTKAVIGRKVQQCHPQKSVHIVNRILEAFKKGGERMWQGYGLTLRTSLST